MDHFRVKDYETTPKLVLSTIDITHESPNLFYSLSISIRPWSNEYTLHLSAYTRDEQSQVSSFQSQVSNTHQLGILAHNVQANNRVLHMWPQINPNLRMLLQRQNKPRLGTRHVSPPEGNIRGGACKSSMRGV